MSDKTKISNNTKSIAEKKGYGVFIRDTKSV